MTSLVPAATPRLQAGQGETTRPSTENTGQLGKEAPISDAQGLGSSFAALRPCQCRVQPTAVAGALVLVLVGSWGGGPALSLMWAVLRACVVVLDCLIRGPAAVG